LAQDALVLDAVRSGGWGVTARRVPAPLPIQQSTGCHAQGMAFVLPRLVFLTERPMAKCEMCGNDYEMSFQVVTAGVTHTFDSFECAIHKLAPICAHCGCKIIGHGIEANGTFYCCAHCAHSQGAKNIVDNAEHARPR
jgi:hypothetical protein